MAKLEREDTGAQVVVESDHLIGRSDRCTTRIDDARVSNEHARIRWSGEQWLLRDLASTNGTTLDGRLLQASESAVLVRGARVAFGHPSQGWTVIDDSSPCATAVARDDGAVVTALDGLLALPSAEQPLVTIHFDRLRGHWVIEADEARTDVADQAEVVAGGRRFRLTLPRQLAHTVPVRELIGRRVSDLRLIFHHSSDLEHIELEVRADATSRRLAPRSHDELLFVLARARLRDHARGEPPGECGWMYLDALCRAVPVSPDRLNVDVYRARRQFAALGVIDPENIVERRSKTRQVRIGTEHLAERAITGA